MKDVKIEQFADYFYELHAHAPYDWQVRLAQRAVEGDWPAAIDLPTGSGKTACLDIAIFALACQANLPVQERRAPRRIFFCVNRRVIVDEAYQRAQRIAEQLLKAERNQDKSSILYSVAMALRNMAGTAEGDETPPLDALELRGGIYRDNRWARSATQPTIICTTIDQLGSRLLFRGYGVSQGAAPIQAALSAYDSIILLDEAHISRPFLQTLYQIQRYLNPEKWAEQHLGIKPAMVVPMTATPPEGVDDKNVIRLSDHDRENKSLNNRLRASKAAVLKSVSNITSASVSEVKQLLKAGKGQPAPQPVAIGIIVNRIAIARSIYQELHKQFSSHGTVELVIGSMRPIDRDEQAERLRELIGPDRPLVTQQTSIVVSTQCLEVGADYDFDVLITECASLDALRQRFGRLNRAGRQDEQGNPAASQARILVKNSDVKPLSKLKDEKPLDPIYGNAIARTWHWLTSHASDDEVDFGIDAMDEIINTHGKQGRIPSNLLAPSASLDAPVILPSYIDFWCQTSPKPVPDPEVSLFIHGPQDSEPDVQACWRADLTNDENSSLDNWCDIVAMLPPTSAECISLPISRLRRWLSSSAKQFESQKDNDNDLLEGQAETFDVDDNSISPQKIGVLWRGSKESKLISSPADLRPGDTLILPASTQDANLLGHLPSCPDGEVHNSSSGIVYDLGEKAFIRARNRVALRLHSSLRSRLPTREAIDELFAVATDRNTSPTIAQWQELLTNAADSLGDQEQAELITQIRSLADPKNGLRIDSYPHSQGVVLATRKRIDSATKWFIPSLDDGNDESSITQRTNPVLLSNHTDHVIQSLAESLKLLSLSVEEEIISIAARLHDLGKADLRFQALLKRTNCTDAWLLAAYQSELLAKSDGMPQTRSQREAARRRSDLPQGFRHEMLSVQIAENSSELPSDSVSRSLALHLIAAHHGRARPFAPVVLDESPPQVDVEEIHLTTSDRLACPSHRIDSGIAERFWQLTRHFGWWGLAYLETLLRLADQQASAAEDAGHSNGETNQIESEKEALT